MQKTNRKPGIHLHRTATSSKKEGNRYVIVTEYYWILIASNGKTIARSSETYKRKSSAIRSIEIVAEHFENNQHYTDHTTGIVDLVVYKIK